MCRSFCFCPCAGGVCAFATQVGRSRPCILGLPFFLLPGRASHTHRCRGKFIQACFRVAVAYRRVRVVGGTLGFTGWIARGMRSGWAVGGSAAVCMHVRGASVGLVLFRPVLYSFQLP